MSLVAYMDLVDTYGLPSRCDHIKYGHKEDEQNQVYIYKYSIVCYQCLYPIANRLAIQLQDMVPEKELRPLYMEKCSDCHHWYTLNYEHVHQQMNHVECKYCRNIVFTDTAGIAAHHCICTICGDTVTEVQRVSEEPHCKPCIHCGEIRTPDQSDHLCFRTNTATPFQFYISATVLSERRRPLDYHGCDVYDSNDVIPLRTVSERPIILFAEGPKCSLPFLVDYVPTGKLKIRPALENKSLYSRYQLIAKTYTMGCKMPGSVNVYCDCSYTAQLPSGYMYDTLQITSIQFGVGVPKAHPCLKTNPPPRRGMYCILRLDGGTSQCIFHVKRTTTGGLFKCAGCETSTAENSLRELISVHFSNHRVESVSPLFQFCTDEGRLSYHIVKTE